MHLFTQQLKDELTAIANAEKAISMKAYMKDQFEFLGIVAPERRQICKQHVKQNVIKDERALEAITRELWSLPEREFQYCAIEILSFNNKLWLQQIIEIIEQFIITKSWWDTVDFLAYDCAGYYFRLFPNELKTITGRWNRSENMWLQRSSLLFQKTYKEKTDVTLLAEYIVHLATSKEFFIQKAIGWVLREYAKTNDQWVKDFVSNNKLAPLSQREALKHL